MNTIQVKLDTGATINYTETEIVRAFEQVESYKNQYSNEVTTSAKIRNHVRDFFSEREWSDRETTVTLDEVNELLNNIGSHAIQTTYSGSVTISLTFSDLDADDADSAIAMIEDEIQVELYGVSIQVDSVNVDDITED
jgi:two-component sensor histidine kinase